MTKLVDLFLSPYPYLVIASVASAFAADCGWWHPFVADTGQATLAIAALFISPKRRSDLDP